MVDLKALGDSPLMEFVEESVRWPSLTAVMEATVAADVEAARPEPAASVRLSLDVSHYTLPQRFMQSAARLAQVAPATWEARPRVTSGRIDAERQALPMSLDIG